MSRLLVDRAGRLFAELFGPAAPRIAVAPGRVNLIGEHTDYNEGFVLPMAIDRRVAVAFRPRDDRRLRGHAVSFGESREADLDQLAPSSGSSWMDYVAGVAWTLESDGHRLRGLDFVIATDLPIGAGLASSAALEVAAALALCTAAGLAWDPVDMAHRCRRAENQFVGTACGIMDQFSSAMAHDGGALLLDCRSLHIEAVTIPDAAGIVVMDTGARRTLAATAYNDRRAGCETAVAVLRSLDPVVRALRDVTPALLDSARDRLDDVLQRRARHVVEEIGRPSAFAQALHRRDLPAAGRLMNESHASLRDLYEVSCPELDLVTRLAREHRACFGARMTGGGFGGCALALVDRDEADDFARHVSREYRQHCDLPAEFFVSRPATGARIIDGDREIAERVESAEESADVDGGLDTQWTGD